jgi:hypothetical protein
MHFGHNSLICIREIFYNGFQNLQGLSFCKCYGVWAEQGLSCKHKAYGVFLDVLTLAQPLSLGLPIGVVLVT